MTIRSIAWTVVALWITAGLSPAEETSWAPCHAQLIVTGNLDPMYEIPWFDGLHIWGTIHVHQVHKGTPGGDKLSYQFLFVWSDFDTRNLPRLRMLAREGVWTLNSLDPVTFTSFYGPKGANPGYAFLHYAPKLRKLLIGCTSK